ncbi:LysR substrate-binding domain-containing protein [Halalkalibacter krulwichiae]|uniref:HTH-type transcriptional regulator CynR n=1 Tax=Halalkalibacter krulwichiae TaxID=199441 RepID=A0A1X9M5Z6_9BACI|nr:LysR substrate-binding domain-containing protein [Halalkalibacter krulwichiae]ARK28868.1 HTH-type transcriptional regulator CynR [Halalkalibacter krulwichiae]
MEIRLLEYFLTVTEELHFTRAAERLGISQPTLSQQIKVLEDSIGSPLFNRVGKKIYITEAGDVLKKHALRTFYELEQAKVAINELKGLKRGKLTIGCCGSYLLTSTIASFNLKYPDIHLSIVELPTEETKQALLTNELDMGIVYLPAEEEQLISEPLFKEEFYLVVSNEHDLASEQYIELQQLENVRMILLRKEYLIRQIIDKKIKSGSLEPIIELTTLESLLQLTALNIGATILPANYLNELDQSGLCKVKIVDSFEQTTVGIVLRKNVYHCESLKVFIKCLKNNYA